MLSLPVDRRGAFGFSLSVRTSMVTGLVTSPLGAVLSMMIGTPALHRLRIRVIYVKNLVCADDMMGT